MEGKIHMFWRLDVYTWCGSINLPITLPKITYLASDRGQCKPGLFGIKAQSLPMSPLCLFNTFNVLENIINGETQEENFIKPDMYLINKVCFQFSTGFIPLE